MKKTINSSNSSEIKKSWQETFALPITITLCTTIASAAVSLVQIRSADRKNATDIEIGERRAREEREIKLIEMFADNLASSDIQKKKSALNILSAMNQELAFRLANSISSDASQSQEIQAMANNLSARFGEENCYAVVGSFQTIDKAKEQARRIDSNRVLQTSNFKIRLFQRRDGIVAITLDGNLTYTEAKKRTTFAQSQNISQDSYVKYATDWSPLTR